MRRLPALLVACSARRPSSSARHACSSTTSDVLRRLGRQASIEISPHQAEELVAYASTDARVPQTVFVNMVQRDASHFDDVSSACERLAAAGFEPVPHVPAARLRDAAHGAAVFESLERHGASAALLVAGNDAPRDVSVASLAECASVAGVGTHFAGFPEGHPYRDDGDDVLLDKLRAHGGGVVTQFTRDPAGALGPWLDGVARNAAVVFVGAPGPAPTETLDRFRDLCGVGPSLHVDGAASLDDDADALRWPTADVQALADYVRRGGAAAERVRLHVYPFGGLDAALSFIDALSRGVLPGGGRS